MEKGEWLAGEIDLESNVINRLGRMEKRLSDRLPIEFVAPSRLPAPVH